MSPHPKSSARNPCCPSRRVRSPGRCWRQSWTRGHTKGGLIMIFCLFRREDHPRQTRDEVRLAIGAPAHPKTELSPGLLTPKPALRRQRPPRSRTREHGCCGSLRLRLRPAASRGPRPSGSPCSRRSTRPDTPGGIVLCCVVLSECRSVGVVADDAPFLPFSVLHAQTKMYNLPTTPTHRCFAVARRAAVSGFDAGAGSTL